MDVISKFANNAEVRSAQKDGGGEAFNEDQVLHIANSLASCAPAMFEYVGSEPLIDGSGLPVFKSTAEVAELFINRAQSRV